MAAISVTTLLDAVDANDSVISLREALTTANGNGESDEITFAESLFADGPGTITLLLGELAITDSVTISGPGATQLIIDASGRSRVFDVDDGDDGNQLAVGLGGFTLTGGRADDGNDESNTDDDFGGGIFSTENLVILDTTIIDNHAVNGGGGISSRGNLIVQTSTIAHNTAANGGGVQHISGVMSFANTTISGNRSDDGFGALASFFGSATLRNSTITGNIGGGIVRLLATANVTLHNTIVAGNTQSDGSHLDVQGVLDSASSHNLIGDPATAGGLVDGNNGNLVGRDDGSGGRVLLPVGRILNPQLTLHGGPTPMHALSVGSPAINAGNSALAVNAIGNPLTTDQRGEPFARINDSVDIGAFESQLIEGLPETLIVTTADDQLDVDPLADLTDLSLREAITLANASPGPETIRFLPSVSNTAIDLSSDLGSLVISDSLTIDGSETVQTTVDGQSQGFRVFDLVAGDVTFNRLTIQGGQAPSGEEGGGIRNRSAGRLQLFDSTVTGSTAKWGGGIYNLGSLAIRRSTISGNTADYGGGVYNRGEGSVTLTNSTVSGNTAAIGGGGLYNFGAATVTHVTVANNSSPVSRGGGIWNAGTTTINNTIVIGSTSGGDIAGPSNVTGASNLIGDPDSAGGLSAAANNILGRDDGAGGRELLPSMPSCNHWRSTDCRPSDPGSPQHTYWSNRVPQSTPATKL